MSNPSFSNNSIFETHIGFPEGYKTPFDNLLASDMRWSALEFDKIIRAIDSERYDAHDVPGGIRYLTTANNPSYVSALEMANRARDLLGANELIRVEIEEVLGVNKDLYKFDPEIPSLPENAFTGGFLVISDFPDFESHISVKHPDGISITDAKLETKLLETGFRFNEYAITRRGQKGIFTMFYDDLSHMFDETTRTASALQNKLPTDYIVKTSMERILYCASFG